MKLIFKLFALPIVVLIDLLTWFCVGMISCSAFFFRLVSSVFSILAVVVLLTTSVQNGLILLIMAFLISPMGIPMLAVHLLGGLQSISGAIKAL